MDFGDNMMLQRKKKGFSQAALGKIIGTSGDVIGRYERGDIKPSIDVVVKIADALEISIDYLMGKTSLVLDKDTIKRLESISQLPQQNKDFILDMLDMALRDAKTKQSYS
ncbi:MAG: helix-turn-helix transcriptional regulator [Cyclobacteriaceae bacterium]